MQYMGSIGGEQRVRLEQHRRDIEHALAKAVPEHFRATHSTFADMVFVPFMELTNSSVAISQQYEHEYLN